MKRLILCCDGTWNRPRGGTDATNVWKFRQALAPVGPDGRGQRVFYQAGVGTTAATRLCGGLLGRGLGANVQAAYQWLMDNYEPGDEIFLVGFSRGAYTARSVAGMVRNCGIVRRNALVGAAAAFALYRDRATESGPDGQDAVRFRRVHSTEATVAFVGVWDTVGALGVPCPRIPLLQGWARRTWGFHDVKLGSHIEVGVQALAIDERRKQFAPTLWSQPDHPSPDQSLEQAWFAGVHSNVGGGYRECAPADLTLAWMMDRAGAPRRNGRPGLAFRPGSRPSADLDGTLADSATGLWRLLPAAARTIGSVPDPSGKGRLGEPDLGQSIDESVWDRMDRDAAYRPSNLPAHARLSPVATPTNVAVAA